MVRGLVSVEGAHRGWRATINRTRRDIRDLLKDGPSLWSLVNQRG
jgi:hypothetical protein